MRASGMPKFREPFGGIATHNLLIQRNGKTEKYHKNAEVTYTSGTRNDRKALAELHGT
jgi:hypothetical protein